MLSYDMPLATTKHGTLHYDVIDGVAAWCERREAILFHHGIGASAEIWAGWRPALVDGYRLVSFDMRGCGRSDIPAADFAWSLDLLVEDLFAAVHLGLCDRFQTLCPAASELVCIGTEHAAL